MQGQTKKKMETLCEPRSERKEALWKRSARQKRLEETDKKRRPCLSRIRRRKRRRVGGGSILCEMSFYPQVPSGHGAFRTIPGLFSLQHGCALNQKCFPASVNLLRRAFFQTWWHHL
uniref:Uncharacterized protein n=1 Tax=Cacopsylla melanoneura TaxID=428564 RepID=A0A8D8SPW4_9HEMI